MKREYLSRSTEETEALGAILANWALDARPDAVFALYGELGAGKTALVRGAAKAAGDDSAASPTFAILHEYSGRALILHYDLYRLAGLEDLEAVGFYDARREGALVFIEWPERAEGELPGNAIGVHFEVLPDHSRRIVVISDETIF